MTDSSVDSSVSTMCYAPCSLTNPRFTPPDGTAPSRSGATHDSDGDEDFYGDDDEEEDVRLLSSFRLSPWRTSVHLPATIIAPLSHTRTSSAKGLPHVHRACASA
ncbi:hypothetical protein NL676_002529 [Syzygium grande]|nr:hypothetical protein NL676_002529 [Syzygium grande]